jgi:acyl carrier protein
MDKTNTMMMRKETNVTNLIKNFIVENFLFGDSDNLSENTDLFKNSVVDSTGILELIAYLEMTFNIKVEDEEILQDNFCSIEAIKTYLQSKSVTEEKYKDKICAE